MNSQYSVTYIYYWLIDKIDDSVKKLTFLLDKQTCKFLSNTIPTCRHFWSIQEITEHNNLQKYMYALLI